MKVAILGAGRRGCALAEYLISANADVILIDNDRKKIDKAKDKLDCIAILGNGCDIQTLEQAQVNDVDFFVAISDKDEVNLISSAIVLSQFGVKNTVACVKNVSYTSKGGLKNNLFGISYIVNPEEEAANNICAVIERGIYSNVITFDTSDLVLYNIEIDNNSIIKDKSLIDIRKGINENFIIACVYRQNNAIVPSGQTIVRSGDIISVVVEDKKDKEVLKKLRFEKPAPKKIIFHGLNQITDYILSSISPDIRKNIVLIEKDEDICEEFSRKYNDNLILNANMMNDDILEEENLLGYDLFVALEDSDELNTIIAHFAKKKGIKHSVALCKREDSSALKALDIDLVVSVTDSTVFSLYKFFQNQTNIESVHTIFDGKIEVVEIKLSDKSMLVGKSLKDINVRQKAIIAGIKNEEGKSFIPGGNYVFKQDDILLVLISSGKKAEVKDIFEI